jgi:tetratricopeptide (TPR) repeat protein
MTVQELMQSADRHHRSGRTADAERICGEVLATSPGHPDALHLMGILQAQGGRLDEANGSLSRAVSARPEFSQAWRNLGCVLVNRGKRAEAIHAYAQLVRLCPADAAAHYALGLLLSEAGRHKEAIDSLRRAGELESSDAQIPFQLGKSLRACGRTDEAIAAYSKAIELHPDFADGHNNLANALRDKGLIDAAITHYLEAVRLRGHDPVTRFNLGNAYSEIERFAEAVPQYERAIALKPEYGEAHNHLGAALSGLGRFDEAIRNHERALSLRPDDAAAHEALGATLLCKNDASGAIACFRRAVELAPNVPGGWDGLGAASLVLGEMDDAAEYFRRAIETGHDERRLHRSFGSVMSRQKEDPAKLQRMAEMLDGGRLPVPHRVGAGFALGKSLDDAGRFDEAFARYSEANALFKEWRSESGERYDAAASAREVDRLIRTFTPEFFARRKDWGNRSDVPVFIVGMPRSGTTLVEQIAASHPAVFGADELPDVARLAAALGQGHPGSPEAGWDARRIRQAADAYLEHLQTLGPGAARVTDKMPGNVFQLGLIAVLFPRARVIFCRRDPRDTCLSCYFQWFPSSRLLYTYDLADCGRQYLQTERVIAHWLKALPLPMMEMKYEELVADQEGRSRRLIEFLGLPWDPACLQFHRTRRTVTTASVWQVRQPMYNRSAGRWRHYERYLGPLVEVLESGMPARLGQQKG